MICAEFSELATGYATYMKGILPHLYNTSKFEIAENAVYVDETHPGIDNVPWKVYPNQPHPHSSQEVWKAFYADNTNQFGKWSFDKVCLDFQPDIVCFPPGTLVLTSNGYQPIEKIDKNTQVFTHKGSCKQVLNTHKKEYKGKLINIYVNSTFEPIRVTPDHPVLVYKKQPQRNRTKRIDQIYRGLEPSFIPAKDVQRGDLVVFPTLDKIVVNAIDITNYLKQFRSTSPTTISTAHTTTHDVDHSINRFIKLDENFSRLIGYIIGDGNHCTGKSLNIFFGIKEESFAKDAVNIINNSFGTDKCFYELNKKENMYVVNINSTLLCEFLENFVGRDVYNKHIPKEILFNNNKEIIRQCICGLVRSGGNYNKNAITFCTINKRLAYEYRILCYSVDLLCTIVTSVNNCNSRFYTVALNGKYAEQSHAFIQKENYVRGLVNDAIRRCYLLHKVNDQILSSVRRVRETDYHGQVYNLEVEEDNSYIAQWCVHNCSISDPWQANWILKTAYRKNFKYIHMPTCDGQPQKTQWLNEYRQCDVLTTYSYWAKNVLETESGGLLKISAVTSPGTDTKLFRPPEDKSKLRQKFGLSPDLMIFQTVMRNQPRKLFPDLMRAFAKYLDLCRFNGREDLYQKSFLYLHTTFPDVGWDLPTEIKRHKLTHKIFFTYMCRACGHVQPYFFSGDITFCPHCGNKTFKFPDTSIGVSKETLAQIQALPDLYIQYSVCLTKDQEVLTSEGWTKIQDIQIGDWVWTHKGRWKPVLDTMIHKVGDRKVLEIEVHGDYEKLQCTEDHPLYGLNKSQFNINSRNLREQAGDCIRTNKLLPECQFFEAKSLQAGDLLATIIDDSVEDIEKIDLAEFAPEKSIIYDEYIDVFHGDTYPRYITVDEEFCKFIGLFVADGYSSINNTCCITCHNDEIDNQILSINIFKRISNKNVSVIPYPDRKAVDIRLFSSLHSNMFKKWCLKHENKKLPDWTDKLPKEKQLAILQGLFMGDGSYSNNQKNRSRKTSTYVTISKILASQIKNILHRNRIYYNCHIDYRRNQVDGKKRRPQYRFEIPGNVAEGNFVTKRNNSRSLYYNNIRFLKIKTIQEIEYDDFVYNLEVKDDNSYQGKICIKHNCEGSGMPQADAKACGVPILAVDYSAMTEQAHAPGGIPIKVKRFFQESQNQTGQLRALPDNDDAAQKMFDFATKPKEEREKLGLAARKHMVDHYDWEKVAKKWERIIDATPVPSHNSTWLSPPKYIQPNLQIPNNLSNEQFIHWCYANILQQPTDLHSYEVQQYISVLNQGYQVGQNEQGYPVRQPINREIVLQKFLNDIQYYNQMEQLRYHTLVLKDKAPQLETNFVEI